MYVAYARARKTKAVDTKRPAPFSQQGGAPIQRFHVYSKDLSTFPLILRSIDTSSARHLATLHTWRPFQRVLRLRLFLPAFSAFLGLGSPVCGGLALLGCCQGCGLSCAGGGLFEVGIAAHVLEALAGSEDQVQLRSWILSSVNLSMLVAPVLLMVGSRRPSAPTWML